MAVAVHFMKMNTHVQANCGKQRYILSLGWEMTKAIYRHIAI